MSPFRAARKMAIRFRKKEVSATATAPDAGNDAESEKPSVGAIFIAAYVAYFAPVAYAAVLTDDVALTSAERVAEKWHSPLSLVVWLLTLLMYSALRIAGRTMKFKMHAKAIGPQNDMLMLLLFSSSPRVRRRLSYCDLPVLCAYRCLFCRPLYISV